jgi:O-antigen/teichoic acid export membrane protein
VPSLSWIALCVAASGVLTYAYLALVARALPVADYGSFGAYWSLSLLVGFGAFLPLEIELARLLHQRGPEARLPGGTFRAAAGLSVLGMLAVLATWPLLSPALGRSTGLLLALLGVCALSGPQFVLRGVLMGRGAVGWYGAVLLADAGLRVAAAIAVAVFADPPSVSAFGWTLPAAVALAHLPVLAVWLGGRRRRSGGAHAAEGQGLTAHDLSLRALGNLLVGSLCAQGLLNAAPVLVTGAAGPDERMIAAAFVASFTLVRIPLFVAVPLQSTLIPPLTDIGAAGDRALQRRLVLRLLWLVAAFAVVAGVVGGLAGPPVVSLVFGDRYALPDTDLAVLAVGSIVHLGLLVASQALVAGARHRDSALAWFAGLVTAVLVFAVVPGLVARAALAFALGSAVALAWSTTVLLRRAAAGDLRGQRHPADFREPAP